MHRTAERREVFHDSNARQVPVVKLAGDSSVPAHLSFDRPVGQPRETVDGRRTTFGGVDRRAGGDVAVAERHYDIGSKVGPFDSRTTHQRRRNVLPQS